MSVRLPVGYCGGSSLHRKLLTGRQDLAVARAGAAATPGADMFSDFTTHVAEDSGSGRG